MPAYSNWRKSSYSKANGNCTEVAVSGAGVHVRDSKQAAAGPVLRFAPAKWATFLAAVKRRQGS